MKILAVLSLVVVVATATSPPVYETYCPPGSSCVYSNICKDGYVDTSGGDGFDLRTKIESDTCDGAGVTCCKDPIDTGDRYLQCHIDQDCVASELCHDGVIVTDGSGIINLRTLFTRNCAIGSVCCRRPDAPTPVDYCPDKQICTEYDYCNTNGHVVEDILTGTIYKGQSCYVNPGVSKFTGVCCGKPEPKVLACPPLEQCTAPVVCGPDGHISDTDVPLNQQYKGQDCYIGFSLQIGTCCKAAAPRVEECLQGEQCIEHSHCSESGFISETGYGPALNHPTNNRDCYIGFSTVIGTCCKQPKPVQCAPGGFCTPTNYCNAKGQLTSSAHSGPTCLDCQICPVGQDTDAVGVCCGPPAPAPPCPSQTECASKEYCDNEGYLVTKPSNTPYSNGQECNLPGGYGGYGVCCKSERPVSYCPIDSECTPKDFCYGNILEADTTDSWNTYGSQKKWHSCALPGAPEGGICCKNTGPEHKCGVSYYANSKLDTRFYTPKLDKLEADFGEMPWQAIVFYSNYTFKCGASLISDRHLLTVAHCVNGLFPYDLKIRLGEWQVNTFEEPLQYQDVDVSAIHIHPEFKLKNVWNNLAILELKQKVNFEYNINTICLPRDGYGFPPGTRCLVGGWGKDSFVGSYQHILKKIDVPLVPHGQCQNLFRKTRLNKYFILDKSYMCAGGEEGKDACVGDGGSPLICFNEQTQSYTQVGITAWGIGCGTKDVPGAYTDVAKFMPWITNIVDGVVPGPY